MAPGILRAQDRVAVWHEAAPTSTPPSGGTQSPGPVVPNSNKFTYPAKALKKLLDTHSSPQGSVGPPHSSKILADFFNTKQGASFAKTYLKPQYAPAIKATVGEDNYAKLLHHLPEAHHQALTTQTQHPAPNSKKFTYPAKSLKKLLDDNPSQGEVKGWVDDHPAFHTYLGPGYEDALKGVLGDVNHAKLKIHTAPDGKVPSDKAQQVTDSLTKHMGPAGFKPITQDQALAPAKSTKDKLKDGPKPTVTEDANGEPVSSAKWVGPGNSPHYDSLMAGNTSAPGKGSGGNFTPDSGVGKTFQDPAFHHWFHSHSKVDQAALGQSIISTQQKFLKWKAKHSGETFPSGDPAPTPDSDADEIAKIKAEPVGPTHEQNLADLGKVMEKQNFFTDVGDYKAWEKSLSPEQVQMFKAHPDAAKADFNNFMDHYDYNAPGAKDAPTTVKGGPSFADEKKKQDLIQSIKKIFPNTSVDLDSMSVPELQKQLEDWHEHLVDTPGLKDQHAQIKPLYDQHFGQGAQSAPSPEPQPAPSGGPSPFAAWADSTKDDPGFQNWFHQSTWTDEDKALAEYNKINPQGKANWSPGGVHYPAEKKPIGDAISELQKSIYPSGGLSPGSIETFNEKMKTDPEWVKNTLTMTVKSSPDSDYGKGSQKLLDEYFPDDGSTDSHYEQMVAAGNDDEKTLFATPEFKTWWGKQHKDAKEYYGEYPSEAVKTFHDPDEEIGGGGPVDFHDIPDGGDEEPTDGYYQALTDGPSYHHELEAFKTPAFKHWWNQQDDTTKEHLSTSSITAYETYQQEGPDAEPADFGYGDDAYTQPVDSSWQPDKPKTFGQMAHDIYPSALDADDLDSWPPEKQQSYLAGWLASKALPDDKKQALEELKKTHFGGGAQGFDPSTSTQDLDGDWHHDESSLPPGFKDWAEDSGVPLSSYSPDDLKAALKGFAKVKGSSSSPATKAPAYEDLEKLLVSGGWFPGAQGLDMLKGAGSPEEQKKLLEGWASGAGAGPSGAQAAQKALDTFFNDAPTKTPQTGPQPLNYDYDKHFYYMPAGLFQDGKTKNGLAPGVDAFLQAHGVTQEKLDHNIGGQEWGDLYQKWKGLSEKQKQNYANGVKTPSGPTKEWVDKHWPALTGTLTQQDIDEAWDKHVNNGGNVPLAKAWEDDKWADKANYGGGGGQPVPSGPPPFDPKGFNSEFKSLFPNSGFSSDDPKSAEAKLKGMVDGFDNGPHANSDKTQQAHMLYDKYFGNGIPSAPSAAKAAPKGPGSYQTPNTPTSYTSIPVPDSEPEELDGISAPAKSEQPKAEDVANFAANKPVSSADWMKFSSWWGKTKLSPAQEQGLYQSWFPHKGNTSPEAASAWFQKVYDHHSLPASGDLTAQGQPAWASASWALGTKAKTEWPSFQSWANSDPGIPKGLNIKQKLEIWNGLSAADKKEIGENYHPANPVDTKAVVETLKKAYPDSDWSKWASMPQGTLKTNVEMLAKAGYDGAIPAFNQYFGGKIPIPKAVPKAKTAPIVPGLKIIPPSKLPAYYKSQYGDTATDAKTYTELKHFGDSLGVNTDNEMPYSLRSKWQQIPPHMQQQISGMKTLPWKDEAGFENWKATQPTFLDDINAVAPEYGADYSLKHPSMSGYYLGQKKSTLGTLIDKETDPQKKQALLGVYHKYFGLGKTTLSQTLAGIYPNEDWDTLLKFSSTADVTKLMKKRLKSEKDPEKWIQLVSAWSKYFPHPTAYGKVAPSGVKEVGQFVKHNPGSVPSISALKQLKNWKQTGNLTYMPDGEEGPYIKSLMAQPDPGGYPGFHGWTPPGSEAMESYQSDPAMLASVPTYTSPTPEAKGKEYTTLVETAEHNKADSHAGGLYSKKDLDVIKSKEFANWFQQGSGSYKNVYQSHPGMAIDDFKDFMAGGNPYGDVPGGETGKAVGKDKYFDVTPFGAVPKPGDKDVSGKPFPRALTHNPPRKKDLKFPHYQDAQETLPLIPGEHFAPHYAPVPIYRRLDLELDEDPVPPDDVPYNKRELWKQQQKARLRRIDEIVNGAPKARNPEQEAKSYKQFVQQQNLDPKAAAELKEVLFPGEQGELGSDDRWQHFADFAKKHSLDPKDMTDLADKMGVSPPTGVKGNYDDPELGKLILDYIENRRGWSGKGGVGTHWTRDKNKLYNGVGNVQKDPRKNNTHRQISVALQGLFSGEGEGVGIENSGHGHSEFGADDPSEREHSLVPGAPVHLRRVQIGSPDGDLHDIIDPGPMSLWSPGRDESVHGTALDKPSLSLELDKAIGGKHDQKFFDTLVPGYQADAVFSKLISENPGEKDALLKLHRDFFVGKPHLIKQHVRRASLARPVDPELATVKVAALELTIERMEMMT